MRPEGATGVGNMSRLTLRRRWIRSGSELRSRRTLTREPSRDPRLFGPATRPPWSNTDVGGPGKTTSDTAAMHRGQVQHRLLARPAVALSETVSLLSQTGVAVPTGPVICALHEH